MKKWLFHAAGILLGVVLLIILVRWAGFQQILTVFRKARFLPLLGALIIYVLSWIFRTRRLKALSVFSLPRIPIKSLTLFQIQIAGYALNSVFPARLGDMAAVGFLKIKGIPIGRAVAIIIQTRILDLMSVVVLSLPVFSLLTREASSPWLFLSPALAVIGLILFFLILFSDNKARISTFFLSKSKSMKSGIFRIIFEKLSQAYTAYQAILRSRSLFILTSFLSLMIWLMEGLTCVCVCAALGGGWKLVPCICAVSAANAIKSVPLTPGGIGIYETVLASILSLFGLPFEIAVAVGIADHALKKLFNLTVGLSALPALGLQKDSLKKIATQLKEIKSSERETSVP
jgi:uncharacterized protein (TIRG00374 family)